MFKKLILTILCLLGAGLAGRGIAASESGAAAVSGQQGVCRGVVVDTRGETVVGAYVLVSGTVRGTMTDASGVFTLDNVGPGAVLRVSIQGYTTKEVAWTGGDLRIVLEDNLEYLDEVVVVAFGTQKKVNLTGAVSTVDAKEISARPVNSVVDATLYNIRRERRNELIGEGMRMADLKRWRALDQVKDYQIEGMLYWGSSYEGKLLSQSGEDLVIVDVDGGTGNMSDKVVSGPYIRPYQISKVNNSVFGGYNFTPAHYLNPLPQSVFRQTASGDKTDLETSVVYQNPGWPKVAGQGPGTVK